ncbi:NPCBM/NEW2 domain-containing protein [Virgibacillus siamensis]|uniref:NPCBM/NEW2 domain-containing protein n=1 Tax=Virgibacillus siamensis TaxID=480071 RepID=UPI00158BDAD0|nr:NPCBM/NEW2 domain-containing protein [Virgibacillus siamensis]
MKRKFVTIFCVCLMFMSLLTVLPSSFSAADTPEVNPKPQVIPGLREWQGGVGSFSIVQTSKIVVDPQYTKKLNKTAEVLQKDLLDITGRKLSVEAGQPQQGDFYLTLESSDTGIGDEGYLFEVEDYVTIRANTDTGVFFGTRTALQILVQDSEKSHIPKGTARDWPKYQERGFMLDVARKFFPMRFLKQYVKVMSWYKMNDFQIHLSDNEIFKDNSREHWDEYSAFRLQNDTYPKLTATDGSYTKQEFQELMDLAQKHGMTITPEIDTPSHALALTKIRPDLVHPDLPVDHLDITREETVDFVKSVWGEYLDFFEGEYVHIGADEFYTGNPETMEIYREYMNTLNKFMKNNGKKTRAWGSLSQFPGETPVDKDIVLNIWNNGWHNPVDAVNAGFDVINTNDALLYMVPYAGYYNDYLNTKLLYEEWEPNIFSLSNPDLNLSEDNPHLLGGMFAVWNDKIGYGYTRFDVHERVRDALPTLAQKMWSGETEQSFEEFEKLSKEIGAAPGTNLLRKIPSKGDSIIHYTFDRGKSDRVKDSSGNGYVGEANGIERSKDGRYGRAAVFDGSSDRISTELLSKGFPWSTSMWVKLDDKQSEEVILESADGALKLSQKETHRIGFSREGYDFSFDYSLPVGQWVHLALTGTPEGTSLYVNGELRDTTNRTLVLPLSTIGSKTKSFKGRLDDFRVYNRSLNRNEIKKLADASYKDVNVAAFKDVVASSSETSQLTPENAVDENAHSRWASAYNDNEWIYVDLGRSEMIDSVQLNWEAAYGSGYKLQVSDDAENWTTVYSTTTGDGEIDNIHFDPVKARYVRMLGTHRASGYGYSLKEFQVFKADSSSGILLSLDTSQEMFEPGSKAEINATLKNVEGKRARDVQVELYTRRGWEVNSVSKKSFPHLDPGEKVQVTWEVVVPEDAERGTVDFFSEALFRTPGKGKGSRVRSPLSLQVAPPPPTQDTFISELPFLDEPQNGWGPVELDTSNGRNSEGDGSTITLNGKTYEKGLGVHAQSEVTYYLGGHSSRFTADIGVDDEMRNGSPSSVIFQVWGDGKKLFDSGLMTETSETKTVDVNIEGVNVLKLVVTDSGNGNGSDHADWADAKIMVGQNDNSD